MKYANNKDAVIIACFFNPENNPYRIKAFNQWYDSIKHLNHRIVELTIGDSPRQLPNDRYITHLKSDSLLWHKEGLLNYLIKKLPVKFKYVFWMDTDTRIDDLNWLVKACDKLKNGCNLIQPMEWIIHLEQDEYEPSFDVEHAKKICQLGNNPDRKLWKTSCANYGNIPKEYLNNYQLHGHTGMCWGMRRELLDQTLLYDKALVGSFDHAQFHFAVGQFPCKCIDKAFTDNLKPIYEWGEKFYKVVKGKVGYVEGATLLHTWHADLSQRRYLERVQQWTKINKNIVEQDSNGLYVHKNDKYIEDYFKSKENVGQHMKAPKQKKRGWWGWIVSVVVFIFVGPKDDGNSGY